MLSKVKVVSVKVTKVNVIGQGQKCKISIFNLLSKVKVTRSKVAKVKVTGSRSKLLREFSAPSTVGRYDTWAF